MKTVLVAACALVDPDDRVLLAQRPPGKAMAGLWEFPGGKVDPGETPEVALIRELHEELGIDVTEACLAPFTFASHPLRRLPPPDAALCVPQVGGFCYRARRPGTGVGPAGTHEPVPHAAG